MYGGLTSSSHYYCLDTDILCWILPETLYNIYLHILVVDTSNVLMTNGIVQRFADIC